MNPLVINLAFLVINAVMILGLWIFPLFNLHLINLRLLDLKRKAQIIIDSKRLSPDLIGAELKKIEVTGLELDKVEQEVSNNYISFNIYFRNLGLFSNEFFSASGEANKQRILSLLVDNNG